MVKLKKIPSLAAISAALMSFAAFAEPTVAIDGVRQRYPWNGLVDIDYTVSGVTASGINPADLTLAFSFASVAQSVATSCTTLTPAVSLTADGAHRVTWDAKADGLSAFISDGKVTATLSLLGPATAADAEFMIIDVSGGCQGEAKCPVTYVRASTAASESAAYNTSEYKLGKIVLRKVHAKDKTFRMGEGVSSGDVSNDDPVAGNWHEVGFRKDYFLGIFELTFGQVKTILGNGTDMFTPVSENQYTYGGGMPKEDYNQAPAYKLTYNNYFVSVEAAKDTTSLVWRGTVFEGGIMGTLNNHLKDVTTPLLSLPTEAQWEYVARAGSWTTYPTGSYYDNKTFSYLYDLNLLPYAWCATNSKQLNFQDKEAMCMHVVGTREPNPWGFYDTLGNAAELVSDWYDSAGYASGVGYDASGVTWDPTGPADDAGFTRKVARGGDYTVQNLTVRPGYRGDGNVNVEVTKDGNHRMGVRLKAAVDESQTPAPSTAIATAVANVALDVRTFALDVLVPTTVSEILPFVWNSAADWAKGGDDGTTATVTVTKMTGSGDPSGWTEGTTETILNEAGEGTASWQPKTHDRYRVRLAAGETTLNAYYDFASTEGIVEAKQISACTVTLAAESVEWTGVPAAPAVTVTDGGKTLTQGVDYITATSEVDVGPATVTVSGIGDYQGSVVRNYTIVEPVAGVVLTRVQQRYPWNGLVDIDYTVTGTQMNPSIYDLALTLTLEDAGGNPVETRLTHFLQAAGCDLPSEPGSHRVTWDSAADDIKVLAPTALFKAKVTKNALTPATADFMIVDLSVGSEATSYPVRLGTGSDTSVFNLDLYKLDRLVLRRVSAGDYWIGTGNPAGDITKSTLSIPSQRLRVRLTKDYYLGVFEVTQRQYERVMGANPSHFTASGYGSGLRDDFRRPVERVSYDGLMAAESGFFALLSAKAKVGATAVGTYQPPTEAQWEIAARADVLTEFWWGTSANYGELMKEHMWNSNNSYLEDVPAKKGTHPVGLKPANPWGFYDILGNVSEWTRDWYVSPYSLTGGDGIVRAGTEADPVVDPCQTDESGGKRVLRGGHWNGGGDYYSHYAGWRTEGSAPTGSANTWGVRVSLTMP